MLQRIDNTARRCVEYYSVLVTLLEGVEIQPCISYCDTVQRRGDSTVY